MRILFKKITSVKSFSAAGYLLAAMLCIMVLGVGNNAAAVETIKPDAGNKTLYPGGIWERARAAITAYLHCPANNRASRDAKHQPPAVIM